MQGCNPPRDTIRYGLHYIGKMSGSQKTRKGIWGVLSGASLCFGNTPKRQFGVTELR